jgi:hypothetical protein
MIHLKVYNIEEEFAISEGPAVTELPTENSFLGWLRLCEEDLISQQYKRIRQKGLIEQFVQSEPKLQPIKAALNDIAEKTSEPVSRKRHQQAEMIVSETLANIYLQQKRYRLCLETYRKLSLLYPKKRAYFAARIESVVKESEKN